MESIQKILFEKTWLFFKSGDPDVTGKIIFISICAIFGLWIIQFYLYEWFESISGVIKPETIHPLMG